MGKKKIKDFTWFAKHVDGCQVLIKSIFLLKRPSNFAYNSHGKLL